MLITERFAASKIASRMGYTTVAAIGLVNQLEKLGYIARSHVEDSHWKWWCESRKRLEFGSHDSAGYDSMYYNAFTGLSHCSGGIAWLRIYRKIVTYCDKIPNK